MKQIFPAALLSLTLALGGCVSSATNDTSEATALTVLGQNPPGLKAELFAPGLVSTDSLEIEGVFAPGMTEFYFTRQVNRGPINTHTYSYENGEWRETSVEPRTGEVALSPDGNTMYLGNIYRERTEDGWTESKSLGAAYEDIEIMRLTVSSTGTYVFDERDEVGTIRFSHMVDGQREAPKAFDETINFGAFTAHPFIAPDDSYIIWDSDRDGGYGDSDLYISFRQDDGRWGPAINMGEGINTEYEDAYGSVTPDGKYFFFHTVDLNREKPDESFADVFWADADIIESLRPKK
jgi:hypothetical protein